MHEQNDKLNKEIDIIIKNQAEVLELNTMNEMRNTIESINNRMDQT